MHNSTKYLTAQKNTQQNTAYYSSGTFPVKGPIRPTFTNSLFPVHHLFAAPSGFIMDFTFENNLK